MKPSASINKNIPTVSTDVHEIFLFLSCLPIWITVLRNDTFPSLHLLETAQQLILEIASSNSMSECDLVSARIII